MTTDHAVLYDQFRRHAQRFISLIERGQALPIETFLTQLGAALADLYSSAFTLPEMGPSSTHGIDVEVETTGLREQLRKRLGEADLYRVVSDPIREAASAEASLATDVQEIYRSLKAGLALTAHGASPGQALQLWRESFMSEWGANVTGAMRAIYWALRAQSQSGEPADGAAHARITSKAPSTARGRR